MFHAFDTYGTAGLEIQMPSGSSMAVAEQDIRTLAEAGYIYTQNFNTSGTFDFYVTAERVSRRSLACLRKSRPRPSGVLASIHCGSRRAVRRLGTDALR